jgi:hypothetical protein
MNSEPAEWDEKVDLTWREYFNPPWLLPHIGIVRLARRMEQELGKEKAHRIIKEVASELATEWILEKTKEVQVNNKNDLDKAMAVLGVDPIVKLSPKNKGDPCLIAETYKAMDAGDIGYLWVCSSEKAEIEALSPFLRRSIGETLMTGHSYCERQTEWEDE